MFILKRQDVEISSIQHPKREQKIPILKYQDQSFRLIGVFAANQAEEARNYWRDLTDNQGKFCILLEEPDRHSIWGRIRTDQLNDEESVADARLVPLAQASLILLQTVYLDIEDLLGNRQAKQFQKDMAQIFVEWKFAQADSPAAVERLLTQVDPLDISQVQPWEEHQLITLLQELYRFGKAYFGNTRFAEEVEDILQDMPDKEREQFIVWLKRTPLGKCWR